ncbi:MAG: acyl-CoA synthetase FdrA [Candidatus Rokubacteria bacterium]|nr:acyl-CoA synthetase FdrA [Candidatus Rokubacteria bacterium]
MRLTRDMEAVSDVTRAAVMMGTPQNLALLKDAGLLTAEGEAAGPTDLVVAVAAGTRAAAEAARAAAETALTARRAATASGAAARPRSLAGALRALPGATLALISVPGVYAAAEARKALVAGLHVMLFSDNVPLDDEVALKRLARERGLFLMGPDCGTAIVNGVPLGFANAVPRGRIGVAAASGTGLQAVTCHIAAAGEGISQAIGVGGRDLSDEVGGLMMEPALAALAADPATAVICVLGKAPGRTTAKSLRARLDRLGKPCVAYFLGDPAAGTAPTLEDAALAAVALARGTTHVPAELTQPPEAVTRLVERAANRLGPGQRFVRGVYCGGTLAYEAIGLLKARLADVAPGVTGGGSGHRVVDLGEDVFTVGRPHPMIDGTVRREWIEREGGDPETAVLLLDLVLGYGAHGDPAGEILPAIRNARRTAAAAGRGLAVVASVCGTAGDPQGLAAQTAALEAAGVIVLPSNAQAARLAARVVVSRR